jgi:hypothetical protein
LVDVSSECRNCAESIPCSGMTRIATGKVSLSDVCPACKASQARGECPTEHEHFLICGMATRPAASASASAAAPGAPSATTPTGSTTAPRASGNPSTAMGTKP